MGGILEVPDRLADPASYLGQFASAEHDQDDEHDDDDKFLCSQSEDDLPPPVESILSPRALFRRLAALRRGVSAKSPCRSVSLRFAPVSEL
jgi:hypothetical protein